MKTFHLSSHNGQWLYSFQGDYERDLPRYDCVYCGSGDYILSAKHSLPMDDLREVRSIEGGTGYPLQPPTEVPEPQAVVLVVSALLAMLVKNSVAKFI